jgi:transcriptional regulator with GAF, ATPase, and Fis domain
MDKNEFSRESTLRICGSLNIEKGLQSCLEYISEYIPADSLYLERYDNKLKAMKPLARASAERAELLDLVIPFNKEAEEAMEEVRQSFFKGSLPSVIVINDPENEPVTSCLLRALKEPVSSAMSLPLFVGKQVAGTAVVLAEGKVRFKDHHTKLFEMLREPFFVAISNTLQHQNEIKLYERNFFWEASKKICGNLEIENALQELLHFLKNHMPVAKMTLQYYDHDYKAMRTVALANETEASKADLITPLSKESQEIAGHSTSPGDIWLVLDIDSFPVSREMTKFHSIDPSSSSLIVMALKTKQGLLGYIVFISEGEEKFTEENKDLLLMLQEPLTIAMSNTLKHREVVKFQGCHVQGTAGGSPGQCSTAYRRDRCRKGCNSKQYPLCIIKEQ